VGRAGIEPATSGSKVPDTFAASEQFAARARLRAYIAAAGEPLPACEALLALERAKGPHVAIEATDAALEEISRRLAG